MPGFSNVNNSVGENPQKSQSLRKNERNFRPFWFVTEKGIGGWGGQVLIFFCLTHLKIWIIHDKNLFTELKNLGDMTLQKWDVHARFWPFVWDFL